MAKYSTGGLTRGKRNKLRVKMAKKPTGGLIKGDKKEKERGGEAEEKINGKETSKNTLPQWLRKNFENGCL